MYLKKLTVSLAVISTIALLSGCQTNTSPNNGLNPTSGAAMQANFNAASQIAMQGNAFGVSARLTPGDTVKVGEAMVLQVQSARAGRVWVISVDASDKVDVLFPNAAYRDNAVKADAVVRIPPDGASGRLVAAEPRGDNRILVVMTAPDQTLNDVMTTSGGLRLIAKPDDKSWAASMLQVKVQ